MLRPNQNLFISRKHFVQIKTRDNGWRAAVTAGAVCAGVVELYCKRNCVAGTRLRRAGNHRPTRIHRLPANPFACRSQRRPGERQTTGIVPSHEWHPRPGSDFHRDDPQPLPWTACVCRRRSMLHSRMRMNAACISPAVCDSGGLFQNFVRTQVCFYSHWL